jgi:uracil-DNA glycosylase
MAKIVVVGEAWNEEENRTGKPFSGAAGRALMQMLRTAGVDLADCHFTNVFNLYPEGNKVQSLAGDKASAIPGLPKLGGKHYIHKAFAPEIQRLYAEILDHSPNVVILLGATPLWALTNLTSIKAARGTPASLLPAAGGFKALPTYSPSAMFRQWKLRPIIIADLEKAKRESEFPEIRRPTRFIHIEPEIEDLDDFYHQFIVPAPIISLDIETKSNTITEVGLSPSPDRALVIPFWSRRTHNYWSTPQEETYAWRFIQKVCAEKPCLGQNFSYDIAYLWMKMGIKIPRLAGDTMILHHALYPEMEKSLGFLGSIYTNEPSWKLMREKNDTLKDQD